jgi:hypothetical protein
VEATGETLTVFVLLLPGFLASIALNLLLVRRPQDNLSKLIEALVLSFLIYAVLFGVFGILPMVPRGHPDLPDVQVNARFLLAASALSLAIPMLIGFLVTNDLHMRLMRSVGLSSKTARDTTWLDVFTDQKRYVVVNLSGGRRVFGWPLYYSNSPEEGLLYLYDPAWIGDDGAYTPLDTHGIFLVERGSI